MKTLTEAFHDWASTVHGADYKTRLPQFQLQETERAFVSGFAAYYLVSLNLADLSDNAAEQMLRGLNQEIQDYFKSIKSVPPKLHEN